MPILPRFFLILLPLFSAAIACTTSYLPQLSSLTLTASPTPSVTATNNFIISNVTINGANSSTLGGTTTTTATSPSPSATSAVPTTHIYFDTTSSTTTISTVCNTSTSTASLPCFCQYSWNENNSSTGSVVHILRKVQTSATEVQPNMVACQAPPVWGTEITSGAQLKVTLVAGTASTQFGRFTVNTFNYTVPSNIANGSFQDAAGHIFSNILRYTCYQTLLRGMSIQNKQSVNTNSTTGETLNSLYASQFCMDLASGGSGQSTNCPNLPGSSYSAQSHYFHFYIRDSERGDINQFDSSNSFVCPLIKEALGSNNTIGTQAQPWPLDSTFALSMAPTSSFPVGVVANTKLNDGSQTAVSSTCYPNPTASTVSTGTVVSNSQIITSCLGFAAKTNSDGTCSSIKDTNGLTRQTFRLRRYVAIYPPIFDTNGNIIASQPQGIDTIYVLDRPVSGSTNPLKPYTMLGPKPCPFAYFDRKGVVTSPTPVTVPTPSYASTSNPGWTGKNVDGIELPNQDLTAAAGGPSCSTALPILNNSKSAFAITTVNLFNSFLSNRNTDFTNAAPNLAALSHVYIRPIQAFIPHYEEDTDFQACAPQASPIVDPPLHFARDSLTGNVSWCAETYPTQNPNITSIDPPTPNPIPSVVPSVSPSPIPAPSIPTGSIAPYTSHVASPGTTASHPCASTSIPIPTTNYAYNAAPLSPGYAAHPSTLAWPSPTSGANCTSGLTCANQTCDRTVVSSGLAWPLFPLLAPAPDIEANIVNDRSYMCLVSYDSSGTKTNQMTPSDGCCNRNSVYVPTNQSTPTASPTAAHLEPDVSCNVPHY